MTDNQFRDSFTAEIQNIRQHIADGEYLRVVEILESQHQTLVESMPLQVVLAFCYELAGMDAEAADVRRVIGQAAATNSDDVPDIEMPAFVAPENIELALDSLSTFAESFADAESSEELTTRLGDRDVADGRNPDHDVDSPEPRIGAKRPSDRRQVDAQFDEGVGSDDNSTALRAVGLTKRYKRREVVSNVSLDVRQGEIVGLLGPNGAGKTTTFHMIVGMAKPEKGRIFIGEKDVTNLPMYKRSRNGVGYLAQEASIFTQMTVEDNLHAVLEYQRLTKSERQTRVEELIVEFRLETVRRSKGYTLSGGERRRTEIARAVSTRPKFFLLDEPFAGVDPIAVEDIQEIVAQLKRKGIGVLITDHNVHETLAITDRAYLLYEGKILMQGSAEALASDPEVRKRYLGEKFKLERYE